MLAGSFSFIGFSIVGSVLPLLFPERGSQMTHVIIALLLLVSGVYYPVSVLPQWMQTASLLVAGNLRAGRRARGPARRRDRAARCGRRSGRCSSSGR